MERKTARKIVASCMMVSGLCMIFNSVRGIIDDNSKKEETKPQVVAEKAYIVEDDVLHTGSILKVSSNDYVLTFNCGKNLYAKNFKAYTIEPTKESYGHKCEECFSEEMTSEKKSSITPEKSL